MIFKIAYHGQSISLSTKCQWYKLMQETERCFDQLNSIFKRVTTLRCSLFLRKLLSHCWHWRWRYNERSPRWTMGFDGITWSWNEIRWSSQIRRLQTIISDRLSIFHGLTSSSLLHMYKSRSIDAAETSMHEHCSGTFHPNLIHDNLEYYERLVSFSFPFFERSNRNKVLNKWRDIRGDLRLLIFFSRKNCEILRV